MTMQVSFKNYGGTVPENHEREVVDRWQELVEDGVLIFRQPVVVATART